LHTSLTFFACATVHDNASSEQTTESPRNDMVTFSQCVSARHVLEISLDSASSPGDVMGSACVDWLKVRRAYAKTKIEHARG